MAQFPGKPIIFRMLYANGVLSDSEYTITVNETGVVGDGMTCDNVGDEYNPLAEIDKYGQPNPYQDPARGRISGGKVTSTSTNEIIFEVGDEEILLNLEGKDGILGRSVTIADDNGAACGVIVRDALPV